MELLIQKLHSAKILNSATIKRVFFKKIIKYKPQKNLNYNNKINNNANNNYKIVNI